MLNIKKIDKKFQPDCSRVIVKPHIPADVIRIKKLINKVLNLSEEKTKEILDGVIKNFSSRHKNIWEYFNCHYNHVKKFIPQDLNLSENRRALIGAYFSCEYSIQSAAFFNPSIVQHPEQNSLDGESLRFILSFRSVGEGHISSIEFRSGVIDKYCNFNFDETSCYAQRANSIRCQSDSDYELQFCSEIKLCERTIFPVSQNEKNGIEDARFVHFVDDDGSVTYYATYTAYDGQNISPKIIETKDFITFRIISLSGAFSKNKGMALFPKKINGKYAMISRVDGENLYIMYSDNIKNWEHAELIKEPENSWEFVQIGNCGSPIETEHGWILLTHGVGPMREYSIGVALLDLENPARIIGNMNEPLLVCNQEEREGYVPNVVYSCGSIVHNNHLIIPYAMSDTYSGIATINLSELFKKMQIEEESRSYAKST